MQKFSKWQLFKWDLQRDWQNSWIRRYPIIAWAYLKILWSSWFVCDEFSKFLLMSSSAMMVMNSKQRGNYSTYITKVRAKIGGHTFDPKITMREIDQQFSSLVSKQK